MYIQILFAAVLIVFMCIFLLMIWKVYKGMKRFLSENIEEALLVSGEYIGEQIQGIDRSMRQRMNVIEKSNYALREELTRKLEDIAAALSEANDKAETGINGIVKELHYIIPSIRDEMTRLLDSIAGNIDSFQKDTIKNLEVKIKELTDVIDEACKNLENSSNEQSKQLTKMAGTIQSVLEYGERDIQSAFEKTHESMQKMIEASLKKIKSDYQDNMKEMFKAMADNLAAITQELRKANTPAVPVAPVLAEPAVIPEDKPEPKKTTRGRKKKNDETNA